MEMATIQPRRLEELRQQGENIDLIDVRTPAEFREAHVGFARNLPLDSLDCAKLLQQRNGSSDQPVYVICRSGNRGRKACEKLLAAGCNNVINVEGGTQAWEESGLPVVRGEKAMSLERQVRIAAGFLVLLGAVLALVVHHYFALLPAFVGAGLIFAGVTDTCGMAMVLAKMPWNQVKEPNKSETSAAECCSK